MSPARTRTRTTRSGVELTYSGTNASFSTCKESGGEGGGGEGLRIPINGLIGMCCWMGSHFHDWNDSNGVVSSTEFPTELLEWGRKLSAFWG